MKSAKRSHAVDSLASRYLAAQVVKTVVLAIALLPQFAHAETFDWHLPQGMQRPAVPEDNPMSQAKVKLGRRLFFDIRRSGPGYMTCATCHKQSFFTDAVDTPRFHNTGRHNIDGASGLPGPDRA